jgi:hypothetical protein
MSSVIKYYLTADVFTPELCNSLRTDYYMNERGTVRRKTSVLEPKGSER